MVEVRITGAEQIRALARRLAAADKGLGREMSRALNKALDPVGKAIDREAAKVAPSGYQATLARSLKHRRSLRSTAREASVRLITNAKGKAENRDLPAIEAGNLRHPVYGRTRKTKRGPKPNPWAVTSIRAGFHKRGTASAAGEAEKQLLVVLDDFAQRLTEE